MDRNSGWKFSQAYEQKKFPRLLTRFDRELKVWCMFKVEGRCERPRIISVKRDRDELLSFARQVLATSGVTDAPLAWEVRYWETLDPTQGRSNR